MTKTDQLKNDVATRYNKIKNAPAWANALTVVAGVILIVFSLVCIVAKLIAFCLLVIRYWLKAIAFVIRWILWAIDKLVPNKKGK